MKDISKKIPLITAFLLTTGFVSSYSYYSHFQIDIFTFQTSGELILSFLPFIIPLFIAIIFILFYSLLLEERAKNEMKTNKFLADKDLSFWGPFEDLSKLIKNKFKSEDRIADSITHYIIQIPARIIFIAFFGGSTITYIYAFVNKQGFPFVQPITFFIITTIWLIIIAVNINKYLEVRYSGMSSFITQFVLITGFLGMIYIFNSYKAYRVLENKPLYNIELNANGIKIESDSSLLYIGKTKEYYFLRNLKNDRNMIIKDSDVDILYLEAIKGK